MKLLNKDYFFNVNYHKHKLKPSAHSSISKHMRCICYLFSHSRLCVHLFNDFCFFTKWECSKLLKCAQNGLKNRSFSSNIFDDPILFHFNFVSHIYSFFQRCLDIQGKWFCKIEFPETKNQTVLPSLNF